MKTHDEILVLARDVKNPTPDKRKKELVFNPIIPAGTRFRLQEYQRPGDVWIERFMQVLFENGRVDYERITQADPRFDVLMEAAVPDADTHANWMAMNVEYHGQVLLELLESGVVTREQVRAANEIVENRDD